MTIRRERTFVRRRRIALGAAAATLVAGGVYLGVVGGGAAEPTRRCRAAPRRAPRGRPASRRPRGSGTRTASPSRVRPPRRRRVPPPTRRRWCVASGSPATSRRSRSWRPRAGLVFAQNMMYTPHRHGVPARRRAGRDHRRRGRPVARSGSTATRARRAARRSRRRSPPTARTPTCPTTRCTARASAPRASTPARPSDGTDTSFVYRIDTRTKRDRPGHPGRRGAQVRRGHPRRQERAGDQLVHLGPQHHRRRHPPGHRTPCRWTATPAASPCPRTAPRRTSR